ncbi:MAG: beta-L-arabinofuranosidase domain-containing protein, partial [Armatimonadota bacterium]
MRMRHRNLRLASVALLWGLLRGIVLLAGASEARAKRGDEQLTIIKSPHTDAGNDFYVSNRPPLTPSPLIKLPIGSIRPKGWLRHQLRLMADGMTGHLPELSKWCKAEGSAWMSPDGRGDFGWEELPYWLKGFGDLGYVLQDERIIREARKWIEAMLSSQEDDGYFGPRANKDNNDLWPNMIALNVLQSFYEATGDERVLPFMTRYFHWEATIPSEQLLPGSWQKVRGGDNLQSIYWLYNHTGESWLLDLARTVHERTADWTAGIASWHGVNISQGFREPAQYYQQARDRRFLQATERNYQTVMGTYGQVPGGMFGADENCRPGYTGPRQAAETCSMVEFMLSDEMLLKITGDPVYADRCEEIAFNSLPAAHPPDLKGLHYLTAPNMVQLDRHDKSPMLQNRGNMLAYDPRAYRCCQHNVSHGWPYYAEHLWLATHRNGLAAVLYAPCEVEARVGNGTTVRIVEDTDYPFDETIRFRLTAGKPVAFPMMLRIPRWCEGAALTVNGEDQGLRAQPSSYVVIQRTWNDGDEVILRLPMRIRIRTWHKNHNAVSVDRGPLTYSLRIGERWERYGGTDQWPAYEVFPTTPWNYGLVLDPQDPAGSFEVVRRSGPLPDQPFTIDGAPIHLVATGKRIPEWRLEPNGLVGAIQDSPVRSDEPEESITLIPMGCGRLRISSFPVIGDGPDANVWQTPPLPPTASHCNPGDTVTALNDGLLPKNSNDHSIPRFTWWDHLGTNEWVAYTFEEPRRISWAEVYWFDDTGVGRCRVPESWRLMYEDGDQWRPVRGASAFGTQPDRFNRVTFEPVVTDQLRL